MKAFMKEFLIQFFTWWNSQTLGTRFYTWRYGEFVGEDEYGNRYYRQRNAKTPVPERRWVIYNGEAEASRVPPGWYGWLHHTLDAPPTETPYTARPWEKPHEPNPTGTERAYRPRGNLLRGGTERPKAYGDYEPWTRA